jgi:hypothetical protein
MTPALLKKIRSLIAEGANIVGVPPVKSPSLTGYPGCDAEVRQIAEEVWGDLHLPKELSASHCGKGVIIWGEELEENSDNLYPHYDILSGILKEMKVAEDFRSEKEEIRYTHRTSADWDIYFLSNKTNRFVSPICHFRVGKAHATLWDPITGKSYSIDDLTSENNQSTLPLKFEPYQSYFIVFDKKDKDIAPQSDSFFQTESIITSLTGSWDVSFNPAFGGPRKILFDSLTDWSQHPDDGVRYYSGIVTYTKIFNIPAEALSENKKIYVDLGEVKNMARVKLNGKEVGIVWTNPWKLDISALVRSKNNLLEIEVANLWVNRLIGDENLADDGIRQGEWPDWILRKEKRPSKRYTFTTYKHYSADSPLEKSGLLGPVTIRKLTTFCYIYRYR